MWVAYMLLRSRSTGVSGAGVNIPHVDSVANCLSMRLTDYTDYSLRVLLYLAVRSEGLATIQDISDAYGISKNHLMKVVQRLAELGWVETVRGRNGGLRLFEHSSALTVGEVVRAAESDFALVACFTGSDANGNHRDCVIQSQCRLKGIFESARDAFFRELDGYSIRDIAEPASPLMSLLALKPSATVVPIVPVVPAVSTGT
jgi:Rrf2 family transcriptional regulator, nitric oxide-sensitive transcriptional repressor